MSLRAKSEGAELQSRKVEPRVPAHFEGEKGLLREHPRTELLLKQHEVDEFDRHLERRKEAFKERMTLLDEKQKLLADEELKLQKEIQKQSAHIHYNEEKRQKALRKIHDEHQLENLKKEELKDLLAKEARLQQHLSRQERKLQKLQKYPTYLDKVVDESEACTEISDIMDRHSTLHTTYKDLLKLDMENQNAIAARRMEFATLKETKGNEVLGGTNEAAYLQNRLDSLRDANTRLENRWQHICNTAAKQTLLLGQLRLATADLYMAINQHLGNHRYKDNASFGVMLERAEIFMKDLTDITSAHSLYESGSSSSITLGGGSAHGAKPPVPEPT